jgi:hypothetical protein
MLSSAVPPLYFACVFRPRLTMLDAVGSGLVHLIWQSVRLPRYYMNVTGLNSNLIVMRL